MKQQLVWNFEFSSAHAHPVTLPQAGEKDKLKWEARFFWPSDLVIVVKNIDANLLDLNHYEHKQKIDTYFLIPNGEYNIKSRRNQILYKPLLERSEYAQAFGKKIDLEHPNDALNPKLAAWLLQQVRDTATQMEVKKESYTYQFPLKPRIKLELAKLELHNGIYFSACIEGRSRELVETISQALLGKKTNTNYQRFLKTLIPL